MKIKTLEFLKLEIPFRVGFQHASAKRVVTESVLAVASSEIGEKGYGEGCPRSYVTSENIESASSFFQQVRREIVGIEDLDSLRLWVAAHRTEIDKNPAAWCSLETALLDLLGRESSVSLERVLGLPELKKNFYYTAVLGVAETKVFQWQLQRYSKLGFRDFKVKISGDPVLDSDNIGQFRDIPQGDLRVRLDANNLWRDSIEASNYIRSLDLPFWAVEEPLAANDYYGLKVLADRLGCRIILDESFLRREHFDQVVKLGKNCIVNLRVSKMGGLLRSLEIGREAEERGIGVIIGAQVGETSILSRMALSAANFSGPGLLGQEGAFGTYLLEKDICDHPVMFGEGGILNGETLSGGSGIGIEVDQKMISKYTTTLFGS